MIRYLLIFQILLFNAAFLLAQDKNLVKFNELNSSSDWKLKFKDSGKDDWQKNWFLDGLKAKVQNTSKGMLFTAGPIAGDDSNHAVLWTKQSFNGDVKIEFDYTRIDTMTTQVNILYIQATGVAPFDKDISKWNNERTIPSMKTYFNNMKCLHISYAAFDQKGEYIRARLYPVAEGAHFNTSTEIPPASYNTNLFIPGKTYKITLIKNNKALIFNVQEKGKSQTYSWDITDIAPTEGRIGLRHMYIRSSLYKNIKIYEKN